MRCVGLLEQHSSGFLWKAHPFSHSPLASSETTDCSTAWAQLPNVLITPPSLVLSGNSLRLDATLSLRASVKMLYSAGLYQLLRNAPSNYPPKLHRGDGRGGGAGRSRTGRSRRKAAGGASGASGEGEDGGPPEGSTAAGTRLKGKKQKPPCAPAAGRDTGKEGTAHGHPCLGWARVRDPALASPPARWGTRAATHSKQLHHATQRRKVRQKQKQKLTLKGRVGGGKRQRLRITSRESGWMLCSSDLGF
ncbi:PREDICTED: uncharacterized protein LOC106892936 [Calidris pugnax]|uniref:uncharacterized protein LOC106892936 n=1 Tax=Calidris pugnax TaxID=198806 RepID=UPI00071D71DC|nr:PREDICTED: uncharacterized protein LOC106892936 [Calidris pugnax]